MMPFSGSSSWVELLLAVGGGLVLLIYVYQVFWPKLSGLFFPKPDYEERAAELLQKYEQQRAKEGASEE